MYPLFYFVRDMGVRNQLAFRDGTDVRDTSTRACRNDLRGLDTSQNTSTDILRGNTSDLAEELGVRPLTSGHVTGSGGGDVSMVHNLSQHTPQNMAPPNDSQSSLRQLSGGRPTPNCRQVWPQQHTLPGVAEHHILKVCHCALYFDFKEKSCRQDYILYRMLCTDSWPV